MEQLFEVASFIVRFAILPAFPQHADPLEGQGAEDHCVLLAILDHALVIDLWPQWPRQPDERRNVRASLGANYAGSRPNVLVCPLRIFQPYPGSRRRVLYRPNPSRSRRRALFEVEYCPWESSCLGFLCQ